MPRWESYALCITTAAEEILRQTMCNDLGFPVRSDVLADP